MQWSFGPNRSQLWTARPPRRTPKVVSGFRTTCRDALTEASPRPDSTDGRDLAPEATEAVGAAVAVVTSPLGVLALRS
ncbi:MAG: hypothetical protein V7646_5536 [Pseudonocardia sp.]